MLLAFWPVIDRLVVVNASSDPTPSRVFAILVQLFIHFMQYQLIGIKYGSM